VSNNRNHKNVTVVFTQDGEHIHNWESGTNSLEPTAMLEAACSSGLVDCSKPLDFITYLDDEIDCVLLEGSFKPEFIALHS
jgi:hypothetical protein